MNLNGQSTALEWLVPTKAVSGMGQGEEPVLPCAEWSRSHTGTWVSGVVGDTIPCWKQSNPSHGDREAETEDDLNVSMVCPWKNNLRFLRESSRYAVGVSAPGGT